MLRKFFKKSVPVPAEIVKPVQNSATRDALPARFLQKLIPIGDLPVAKLIAMPASIHNFAAGDIIFTRGEQIEFLAYLYDGEIFMETANGSGYSVIASTFKAYYPLSTGSEHTFSAIAKTAASVIYLPLNALQESNDQINNPLINPDNIPEDLRNSRLFNGVCAAYRSNSLRVPALPDVALRLRTALQKDISISDAVKIINLDSVIASKLIQVTNSPIYRTLNPAANCFDAVNRLGLKTTQHLATSISLNNLFKSRNKMLNNKIQTVWKQSIHVASLSYTLARISGSLDPEAAMLAGLIHNIGVLPIITFAEDFEQDAYTQAELEQTITVLQPLLGAAILKKWHFPEEMQDIPMQIANWYYDKNRDLLLNDIVLLAKFHSELGTPNMQKLPPLNTLPAFHKLGDAALTPDMSLKALHDAKQQVAEALSFFRD